MVKKKRTEEDEEEEEEDEGVNFEEEGEEDEEEEMLKPKKKFIKPKPRDEFNWENFSQPEFIGLKNRETQEVITHNEAIRRILSYAEEAAKNTR